MNIFASSLGSAKMNPNPAVKMDCAKARVGWVERSDTHHFVVRRILLGIAALNPTHETVRRFYYEPTYDCSYFDKW